MTPRRRRPETSVISPCVKFTIFFINFFIWLIGLFMIAVGGWAFVDKYSTHGAVEVQNAFDIILDLSIVLMVVGGVVFIISFAGCIGALRENTCLLGFYSMALAVIFFCEIILAIIAFIFPDRVLDEFKSKMSEEIIVKYRDDDDLKNLIDLLQKKLQCCGISDGSYKDWNKNVYFNCSKSNPAVESCGVPYSCCRNTTNISGGLLNMMCGFEVQKKEYREVHKLIYTDGCFYVVQVLAKNNLYIIAGIALAAAVAQMVVLNLARTLKGQIEVQKERDDSWYPERWPLKERRTF